MEHAFPKSDTSGFCCLLFKMLLLNQIHYSHFDSLVCFGLVWYGLGCHGLVFMVGPCFLHWPRSCLGHAKWTVFSIQEIMGTSVDNQKNKSAWHCELTRPLYWCIMEYCRVCPPVPAPARSPWVHTTTESEWPLFAYKSTPFWFLPILFITKAILLLYK